MITASILELIDAPADVKTLDHGALALLADEVRAEILRVTARNGGHLATNLGAVELSIAMHYVFDSPRDKIIWDVSNQCYTHKLLTGRRGRFPTIRKEGGLSGFTNREESPHDHMTSGHAGTALSSALGMATARTHLGEDYSVVAVVGDGAMTAGLSFEALNNLTALKSQLLIILNDNEFAISPSCGALAHSLKQAKAKILDGTIFDELGIMYLGLVDGHDLPLLVEVLAEARRINRPVVLHVVTQKGKGYQPAEADPERFHGVAPFDLESGQPLAQTSGCSYSQLFGEELIRLAEEDSRIVAITAAMISGTGLATFAKRFPERLFDVGIAEQHAVTFAAGLAAGGCRPVVAIYSSFLQRGYDQVIHDVCLQDLPVTFVLDRAGLAGEDGPTHHGVFDFGFLRAIPRIVVMAPKDGEEFQWMLRAAVACDGPAAVRIPRGAVPVPIGSSQSTPIVIGRGELLCQGDDVALIAIGSMVHRAVEVADALSEHGISAAVVNARFVKPLDDSLILKTARRVKRVYTIEEHVRLGGFGSAVVELLVEHDVRTPVALLALPDRFIEHGSADHLLHEAGLSTEAIVSRVRNELALSHERRDTASLAIDDGPLQAEIDRISESSLPEDLDYWVGQYSEVGQRDAFLWKWCLEGVSLTCLPCVDPTLRDANNVTKVLGVMFDVLLDDVADTNGQTEYLEQLLKIPFSDQAPDFRTSSSQQQKYAHLTCRLWETIGRRARTYPRYEEFADLLRFDYAQLLNTMRYSHMVNQNPHLLNLTEHDLYLPHNMHMMISGTLDLMCSPAFDSKEIGSIREVLWHAQCMGRVGNLITTWERELREADFTSGVFARALQQGVLNHQQLVDPDVDEVRRTIQSNGCETYFVDEWHNHREKLAGMAGRIRSVDVGQLIGGLEKLIGIHLGSRGLK